MRITKDSVTMNTCCLYIDGSRRCLPHCLLFTSTNEPWEKRDIVSMSYQGFPSGTEQIFMAHDLK